MAGIDTGAAGLIFTQNFIPSHSSALRRVAGRPPRETTATRLTMASALTESGDALTEAEKGRIQIALAMALLRSTSQERGPGVAAAEEPFEPTRPRVDRDALASSIETWREGAFALAGTAPAYGDPLTAEVELLSLARIDASPELLARFLRATATLADELPKSAASVAALARAVGARVGTEAGSARATARACLRFRASCVDFCHLSFSQGERSAGSSRPSTTARSRRPSSAGLTALSAIPPSTF